MNIEQIIDELELRIDGVINLKDKTQIAILSEIISEMGYDKIKNEFIQNLLEGPNDGDNAKSSDEVEKEEEYIGIGGSMVVKAKDYLPNAIDGELKYKSGAQRYKKEGDR